jgi:N-acetylglucosamine-6-phosphate deacetylase
VAAGATVSTHLGNGAHATLPRHPNYVWAQLADDDLRVGLIADGHHLPADTFKAMVRAVGLDRAHLVSDATALAGMPPGRYRTPVGDAVDLSPDGRLSHVGTPYLAGAARGLNECAAIATVLGDLRLDQVLVLAARNPGRLMPRGEPARGILAVGAVADLMTFDFESGQQALRAETVLVRGAEVASGR